MSNQIQTTTDDAQTTKQPLRFEAAVTWDRPLNHSLDDPDRLRSRLGRIPVDGSVSVVEFTDTTATVWVETTPEEMNHSVGAVTTKLRRVIRQYNSRTIGGDSLSDPPLPQGVKRKHVRRAYRGASKRDLNSYISAEAWESAKEIAGDLNLEGAPALEPDISIRTIDGGL